MKRIYRRSVSTVAFLAISGQVLSQPISTEMLTQTMTQEMRTQTMTPEMEKVIDILKSTNPVPVQQLTFDQAREQFGPGDAYQSILAMLGKPGTDPDVSATIVAMPGPSGNPLILKVFRPKLAGEANLPTVLYFHGGGWVIAGTRGYQASCEALAKMANANVVEVAYREAPEAVFPAAHEDCYAALQFVAENPSKFMALPDMISVLGESAGGNIATAVCMMAKDRGGFMPLAQVLVYPVTQEGTVTPSYKANMTAVPLSTPMLSWFYKYYFGDENGTKNHYGNPLNAAADEVTSLPPATFIQAELDPLLSEGVLYYKKLKKAGNNATTKTFMGVTHEFFGMGPVVPEAMKAEQMAAAALTKSWGKQDGTVN